ncbi:phosphoribosyltransferase family protein [Mycolicibacterium septicum]|uniref:orotate phosphoribosyltransferase n=1 Tax=Mycolicibacterium septicum TaxID=98668 RepID=UPI0023E0B415|nr:phosphoribosyltransferase family protein [Mycolicibacterium septicum]MDF3336868.1 phosphoribosyltransferase family protein [Mycolicibacterium septicum]
MDRDLLATDVNRACRLQGQFRLRSGQLSHEYFDKYLFESDPQLLRRVCDAMVPLVPVDTDLLGGLELGGVPLATVLSQLTGIPTLFVRKTAKTYGTCRLAEGADITGQTITLVEDVITTGGAVRDAAQALRSAHGSVSTVICAINRSTDPARRSKRRRSDRSNCLDEGRPRQGPTNRNRVTPFANDHHDAHS